MAPIAGSAASFLRPVKALNINSIFFSGLRKDNVAFPLQPLLKRYAVCCYVSKVDTLLDSVKWDSKGLAVAIVQNVDTGAILMQGFANKEALAKTISTRKATFFSRSRSSLWTKGETSMNFINVHAIFLDCDHDSIIYLGKPDGPTCHTGAETCYYTSVFDALQGLETTQERLVTTTLYSLEDTISRRQVTEESDKPSWTKKLLLDSQLLCSKIREEAGELIQTLLGKEDKSRAASEMADLLYHAMVLLRVKNVKMEEVFEVLRKRTSQSGMLAETTELLSPSRSFAIPKSDTCAVISSSNKTLLGFKSQCKITSWCWWLSKLPLGMY